MGTTSAVGPATAGGGSDGNDVTRWTAHLGERGVTGSCHMEVVMPYTTRDGVRLYYHTEGNPEHLRPPLVFIHGWCCDHTFFQPQVDHFKTSHTVVTMDLRGCGRSDQPEDGYDIATFADDIASLCHELGLTGPVFIGHSMGGTIGIELGARYPALTGAVIAVDPPPVNPSSQMRRDFEMLVTHLEGSDGEAGRRAFVEGHLFLPTDDAQRKRVVTDAMCSVPLRIAAPALRSTMIAWDGPEALERCTAPLLVLFSSVGGSKDPIQLLALKPDIHFGVTVGSGHFHQLEVPEQVSPMIERFLQVAVAT